MPLRLQRSDLEWALTLWSTGTFKSTIKLLLLHYCKHGHDLSVRFNNVNCVYAENTAKEVVLRYKVPDIIDGLDTITMKINSSHLKNIATRLVSTRHFKVARGKLYCCHYQLHCE